MRMLKKGISAGVVLLAAAVALAVQTTVQVKLESTDGNRTSRRLDGQIQRVRLLDRLSDRACTAGRDWGYSGQTLWVDNGCRGVFEVRYGKRVDDKKRRVISLGSNTNARKRVWVGANQRVELIKRLSTKQCVRGSSWGYDGKYVWVSRGCRAQFAIGR